MIDMHADTPQRFVDEGWDFTSALSGGMINLETARRGGLDAEFFAIWVEPSEHAGNFAGRALELTYAVLEQVRRHPAELQLCLTPEDIVQAKADGKFGVLLRDGELELIRRVPARQRRSRRRTKELRFLHHLLPVEAHRMRIAPSPQIRDPVIRQPYIVYRNSHID